MALVVFLRGINVGGHRRCRPSLVAKALRVHHVVNVGAAGTFVVRRPGSRSQFRAALLRQLPLTADIALCDGRDVLSLERENPFGTESWGPDVVRFVSILPRASRPRTPLPISLPSDDDWLVRIIGTRQRFVFGVYRRHMRTIAHLGQIDELFGTRATTRSWTTILAVGRILRGETSQAR